MIKLHSTWVSRTITSKIVIVRVLTSILHTNVIGYSYKGEDAIYYYTESEFINEFIKHK